MTLDGPAREEILGAARRHRADVEYVEQVATYDQDPLRRASALRWLEDLTRPGVVRPIPPALRKRP